MKIKAKQVASIFKAIGKTSFATKNTEDVEELNSVKIATGNGNLQIVSTNSRISVWCKIPGYQGTINGTFDNKALPNCIEAAVDGNGEVELIQNNGILLAVGGAQVPIPNAQEKESRFENVDGIIAVQVLASDLTKAIQAAIISALPGNEVMEFVKLSINPDDSTFNVLSFNGKMMTLCNIPLEGINVEEKKEIFVQADILKAITGMLELVKKEIVDVIIGDGKIMFSSEIVKIVIPYSKIEFVQCLKLLEANFDRHICCSTKELKKAINTAYKAVKTSITLESDGTTTSLKSGDFRIDVSTEETVKMEFTIPIQQMISMVRNMDSSSITISLAGNVLLKMSSSDDDSVIFITGTMK